VASQVTQEQSLPKDPIIKKMLLHIMGPTSMFYTKGPEWKRSRQLLNPGFALSHLMTLIPTVVDDILIFRKILANYITTLPYLDKGWPPEECRCKASPRQQHGG
jgi:hypothetical protein